MTERKHGLQSPTRALLLAVAGLLLGVALSAYWFSRPGNPSSPTASETAPGLSASTKSILQALQTPVKIHYYALLNSAGGSEVQRSFAERVDRLLSEYEREAAGKITVLRHTNKSDAQAASADGIKPFNLTEGDPSFLGLTLVCGDRKEIISQLSPDWEGALESDLSHALARVATIPAGRVAPTPASPPDPAIIAEVKRLIPDPGAVSLENGKQILRDAALKEVRDAMDETQRRVKEIRQRISQADSNNAAAAQQAALQELHQVEAEQTEKLKEFAARAALKMQAFEQIKSR